MYCFTALIVKKELDSEPRLKNQGNLDIAKNAKFLYK